MTAERKVRIFFNMPRINVRHLFCQEKGTDYYVQLLLKMERESLEREFRLTGMALLRAGWLPEKCTPNVGVRLLANGQLIPYESSLMIVPTLCVGTPQRTLRVQLRKGRGASRDAFPRRAWGRSGKRRPVESERRFFVSALCERLLNTEGFSLFHSWSWAIRTRLRRPL
jgi:hypothetical protein